MTVWRWFLGLLTLTVAGPAAAQPAEPFNWRVKDRFRLWETAASGPNSADSFLASVAGQVSPEAFHDLMVRFLDANPSLHQSTAWNSGQGLYAPRYIHPDAYVVVVGLAVARTTAGQCAWSVNSARQADAPCANSVELRLPRATGEPFGAHAVVSVRITGGAGAPGEVSAPIRVRDRLIASVGDSFASGEGNPDRPVSLEPLRAGPPRWEADWKDRWVGRNPAMANVGSASWWDEPCHRSFRSAPVVAAVKYAAERPHEAVTFVSYACSGAAIFNGLVTPQPTPPGYSDSASHGKLDKAQIEALNANLCPPDATGASTARPEPQPRAYAVRGIDELGIYEQVDKRAVAYRCASAAPRRKVDILLVSTGGNDVGFAPAIFDAMLPRTANSGVGEHALRLVRGHGRSLLPERVEARINRILPVHSAVMRQRFAEVLTERPVTLQTVYPRPLTDEGGELCGPADEDVAGPDHDDFSRLVVVDGVWPDRIVPTHGRWHMRIDQKEGRIVRDDMIVPLNAAVEANAQAAGWRVVKGFEARFDGRGWCAARPGEPAGLPNWDPAARAWTDWNPADWNPYVRRTRLFRTPNDAALTQAPARPRETMSWVPGDLFPRRKESLLYGLAGAFHPTFEAHVIMGLSTAEELRAAAP